MFNSLKICIITQEYPPFTEWGGTAIYYKEIVNALDNFGHKVTVITRYANNSPRYSVASDNVEIYRVGSSLQRKYFIGRTFDKLLHAKDVYKKIIDIESENGKFDILEAPEFTLEGYFLIKHKTFRNKLIIQCHGSNSIGVIPKGVFSVFHKLDFISSYKIELFILRKSKSIIVPSKAGYCMLIEKGIPKNKIEILYHGINTDIFNYKRKECSPLTLRVGYVGKIHKMKGIDFIWKVVKKAKYYDNINFILIGDVHKIERYDFIENLREFSNIVVHKKHIMHKKMPEVYKSLDVLLQPSRFEQFGLAYAEAMASGVIVFAGFNGGGSEIIEHNVNGYLVDPDGQEKFVVNKLNDIFKNYHKYDILRIKAQDTIKNKFSIKQSIKLKIQSYRNAIYK